MEDNYSFFTPFRSALRILIFQILLLLVLIGIWWGGQLLYSALDQTKFPTPVAMPKNAADLPDKEKGKLLLDAITNQMHYELDSTFGWSFNDLLFNRFLFDNRGYRQYGVYHATKFILDLFASDIAKLGAADRESDFLYRARINHFAIDPRSFWFPSAEGSYEKGFALLNQYKKSLDDGKGVYNCRTDDLYASFNLIIGEDILGYALGLLQNAQTIPFYTLDNRIYEVQGMVLVVRDFINALYILYPEIRQKNNEDNMRAANMYLDRICTYDPLYITSSFNSGELIISYLLFARARIQDISKSLRI
ncbi:MAG: DUF2333 family protein [Desulfovibrio sp.]|nr:DUF2333 family protein [Desulfovibrio sp.]